MTHKNIFILLLLMASQHIYAQKTHCNIEAFGAVGDGVTLCTEAINSAIVKCSENGGGRVVVPAGVFKSGTILMKSHVELHLEMGSTLLGSTDYRDFPRQPQPAFRSSLDAEGWYALIYAEGLSNIAITGFGTIDGNGAHHQGTGMTRDNPNKLDRPRNIVLISCRQVRVEGIRMLNSGAWNQHYLDCEDVTVDRIEVYNHCNNNNDGINIDACRRFMLSNAIIDSDDDGICLKSSGAAAAEDIVITNCVVSSTCNAIKMGTSSTGGFRNIAISNCIVKTTRSKAPTIFHIPHHGMSAIALEIVDGGVMEGIAISNIVIEGTSSPLFIRLANRAKKHTETAPDPPVGKMRNITISNIVAYHTGNISNTITGLPGHTIENVTMDNLHFFNRGGLTGGRQSMIEQSGNGYYESTLPDDQYVASHKDVPELEEGYPEAIMWGNLPSSLFFIRHVKGLSINNLTFGSMAHDPRIPVIAVDVERLRVGKSIFSGVSSPPCFVLLDDVKEFDIEKPLGWGENPVIQTFFGKIPNP